MCKTIVLLVLFSIGSFTATSSSIHDLRNRDLSQGICLDGDWDFYWQKFVTKNSSEKPSTTLELPGFWNNEFPGHGYGTYATKVIVPTFDEPIGLEFSKVYTAYRIIVGTDTVFSRGVISDNPASHVASKMPSVIPLGTFAEGDTIAIYVQISNYNHYKGGIDHSIVMGSFVTLQDSLFSRQALNLFVAGCFLVVTITLIVFYFMFNFHMKSIRGEVITYAIFCFFIGYNVISSGSAPLYRLVPNFNYEIATRLEIISYFLAGAFGIYYLRFLFPKHSNKYIIHAFGAISIGGAILNIFVSSLVSTVLGKIFVVCGLLVTFHAIYVTYIALRDGARSANYLAIAALIILVVVSFNTSVAFMGLQSNGVFFTLGFLAFSMMNNIALLDRFIWGYKVFNDRRLETNVVKNQRLLMSLVAHEIKTPLSQLKLNAEMLHLVAEKSEPEVFRGKLPKILSRCGASIENLNSMVSDLMHFIGQENIQTEKYTTRCIEQKIKKELDIEVIGKVKSTDRIVSTNQKIMEYLIQTLVNNAHKFTPPEKPSPVLLVEEKKDELILTVIDFGIGMSDAQLEELGKPFIKMDLSKEGTGLGFYISKNLLEKLDHQMTVKSSKDKGTQVSIHLKTKKHDPSAEVNTESSEDEVLPKQADVV